MDLADAIVSALEGDASDGGPVSAHAVVLVQESTSLVLLAHKLTPRKAMPSDETYRAALGVITRLFEVVKVRGWDVSEEQYPCLALYVHMTMDAASRPDVGKGGRGDAVAALLSILDAVRVWSPSWILRCAPGVITSLPRVLAQDGLPARGACDALKCLACVISSCGAQLPPLNVLRALSPVLSVECFLSSRSDAYTRCALDVFDAVALMDSSLPLHEWATDAAAVVRYLRRREGFLTSSSSPSSPVVRRRLDALCAHATGSNVCFLLIAAHATNHNSFDPPESFLRRVLRALSVVPCPQVQTLDDIIRAVAGPEGVWVPFCLREIANLDAYDDTHLGAVHALSVVNNNNMTMDIIEALTQPHMWGDTNAVADPPYTPNEERHRRQMICHVLFFLQTVFITRGVEEEVLLQCLVLVLEKSSEEEPDAAIRRAARGCVASMARGGGGDAFLANNCDYIVDSMCRRLRLVACYPHTPKVIASLFNALRGAKDTSCESHVVVTSLITKILEGEGGSGVSAADRVLMLHASARYLLGGRGREAVWPTQRRLWETSLPYIHSDAAHVRVRALATLRVCMTTFVTEERELGDEPNTDGHMMASTALPLVHLTWQSVLTKLYPPGATQPEHVMSVLSGMRSTNNIRFLTPTLDLASVEAACVLRHALIHARPFITPRAVADFAPVIEYQCRAIVLMKMEPSALRRKFVTELRLGMGEMGLSGVVAETTKKAVEEAARRMNC